MPGVPNASMARQVERAGFEAVYISGAGLANCTAGLPDVGLLTLNEVATLAGFIAKAVKIPAIVDADTGFGGAENVGAHDLRTGARRTGRLSSRRPGISETLRTSGGETSRRRPMRCRRRFAQPWPRNAIAIFSSSRAPIRARWRDFEGAVKRANAYVAAGADAIFPEALQTKEEFRDFAREVKAPLLANMTEFGKSPLLNVRELGELGYRMVIFPQSAFRVSMKTTGEFFHSLQEAGSPKAGSTGCKRGRSFTRRWSTIRPRKAGRATNRRAELKTSDAR